MNTLAVIALHKRLRALIAKSAHRSELLETCDLIDVAIEAPSKDLAPAALSVTEQTPPATPNAVEAAVPADEAERGGGAACSNAGWQGAVMLRDELDRALRRYDYGKLTDADLGLELLRISNELATESKRLRGAQGRSREADVPAESPAITRPEGDREKRLRDSGFEPVDQRAYTVGDAIGLRAPESAPRASEVTPSGGAEALPSGWETVNSILRIYRYAMEINRRHPVVARDGAWTWIDVQGSRGTAPTMLQAMCAALGIAIEPFAPGGFRAWIGEDWHFAGTRDADVCARKALERLHARQQPAPAAALRQEADEIRKAARELTAPMHRADDACKCTHGEGEPFVRVRYPSRYCPVPEHASEWQTLAEQRSELHDDGTPRAGCAVCLGTPELDESVRGLAR